MVTLINYHVRQNKDGKDFVTLTIQGDIELVQSMGTGRFYATARKCSISSTFDERTAETLIGSKMPGTIKRVESEPYDYTIPEKSLNIYYIHIQFCDNTEVKFPCVTRLSPIPPRLI